MRLEPNTINPRWGLRGSIFIKRVDIQTSAAEVSFCFRLPLRKSRFASDFRCGSLVLGRFSIFQYLFANFCDSQIFFVFFCKISWKKVSRGRALTQLLCSTRSPRLQGAFKSPQKSNQNHLDAQGQHDHRSYGAATAAPDSFA
jgi:hypothetical protein